MNSAFSPTSRRTIHSSHPVFARATNVVLSAFRRPGLGHAMGAVGALGLVVATGVVCSNGTAPSSASTLAPIMATGAARIPLAAAATEKKVSREMKPQGCAETGAACPFAL